MMPADVHASIRKMSQMVVMIMITILMFSECSSAATRIDSSQSNADAASEPGLPSARNMAAGSSAIVAELNGAMSPRCSFGDVDLSPLQQGLDLNASSARRGSFYLHVCGNVSYPSCVALGPASACFVNSVGTAWVMGMANTPSNWSYVNGVNSSVGVKQEYYGAACWEFGRKWTTHITYSCDPNVTYANITDAWVRDAGCHMYLNVSTQLLCNHNTTFSHMTSPPTLTPESVPDPGRVKLPSSHRDEDGHAAARGPDSVSEAHEQLNLDDGDHSSSADVAAARLALD